MYKCRITTTKHRKGLRLLMTNEANPAHFVAHDDGSWGVVVPDVDSQIGDVDAENLIFDAVNGLNTALSGVEQDNGLECPRTDGKQ